MQITRLITGDFSEQRQAAQAILLDAFKGALAGRRRSRAVPRPQPQRLPLQLRLLWASGMLDP